MEKVDFEEHLKAHPYIIIAVFMSREYRVRLKIIPCNWLTY